MRAICNVVSVGFAVLISCRLFATTVVVPADDEMIGRSSAIVVGTIEGSYVRQLERCRHDL